MVRNTTEHSAVSLQGETQEREQKRDEYQGERYREDWQEPEQGNRELIEAFLDPQQDPGIEAREITENPMWKRSWKEEIFPGTRGTGESAEEFRQVRENRDQPGEFRAMKFAVSAASFQEEMYAARASEFKDALTGHDENISYEMERFKEAYPEDWKERLKTIDQVTRDGMDLGTHLVYRGVLEEDPGLIETGRRMLEHSQTDMEYAILLHDTQDQDLQERMALAPDLMWRRDGAANGQSRVDYLDNATSFYTENYDAPQDQVETILAEAVIARDMQTMHQGIRDKIESIRMELAYRDRAQDQNIRKLERKNNLAFGDLASNETQETVKNLFLGNDEEVLAAYREMREREEALEDACQWVNEKRKEEVADRLMQSNRYEAASALIGQNHEIHDSASLGASSRTSRGFYEDRNRTEGEIYRLALREGIIEGAEARLVSAMEEASTPASKRLRGELKSEKKSPEEWGREVGENMANQCENDHGQQKFRDYYARGIVTGRSLDWLKDTIGDDRDLVQLDASTGYLAWEMNMKGMEMHPTGARLNEYNWNDMSRYAQGFEVEELGISEAQAKYPKADLVLGWPGRESPEEDRALENFQGKYVVYMGEPQGGIHGDRKFHYLLGKKFNEVGRHDIDNFNGREDQMIVYERKTMN